MHENKPGNSRWFFFEKKRKYEKYSKNCLWKTIGSLTQLSSHLCLTQKWSLQKIFSLKMNCYFFHKQHPQHLTWVHIQLQKVLLSCKIPYSFSDLQLLKSNNTKVLQYILFGHKRELSSRASSREKELIVPRAIKPVPGTTGHGWAGALLDIL